MSKERLWNISFMAACASYFSLFINFYALMASLPLYVVNVLKLDQAQAGLALSAFLVGAILIRPLSGKWADQYDKRELLLLSLGIFFVMSFAYLWQSNFAVLLLTRFFHGLVFGVAGTTLSAIAADIVPDSRKGEGLGYFNTFLSLGMVVGPFLGLTVISQFNFATLYIITIFQGCRFACIWLIKPRPAHLLPPKQAKKKLQFHDFFETRTVPMAITAAIMAFAFGGLASFITLYSETIGLRAYASSFFLVYGLVVIIARPFAGRLLDRYGAHVSVYPFIITYIVALVVLSLAVNPWMFLGSAVLVGIGFGTLFSTLITISVKAAPANRRGVIASTFFIFFDTFMGAGSSLIGLIAVGSSYRVSFGISAGIVVLSLVTYYFFHHRPSSKAGQHRG